MDTAQQRQPSAEVPEAAAEERQANAVSPEAAAEERQASAESPEAAGEERQASAQAPEAAAEDREAGADAPEAAAPREGAATAEDVGAPEPASEDAVERPASAHALAHEQLVAQGMTSRQADAALVQAHQEDVLRQHFLRCFLFVTVTRFLSSLASVALQIWLATAYINDQHLPCSVPLSTWSIVSLSLWAARMSRPCIDRMLCCWAPRPGEDAAPWRISAKEVLVYTATATWVILGIYWTMVDGEWSAERPACRDVSPQLLEAARASAWYCLSAGVWSIFSDMVLRSLLRRIIRRGLLTTSRGAPSEAVERNTEVVDLSEAELEANPSCPICMEDYADNKAAPILKITLCDHAFHDECLRNWLKAASSCPLCREDLTQEVVSV